jgi:hypothetical protein
MIMEGDHQRPWKDGEKHESRLVFIGRKLDGEKLKRTFEAPGGLMRLLTTMSGESLWRAVLFASFTIMMSAPAPESVDLMVYDRTSRMPDSASLLFPATRPATS